MTEKFLVISVSIPLNRLLQKLRCTALSNFFFRATIETFKLLEWSPKYSNSDMIVEAYNWYSTNKEKINLTGSSHRSKVKQQFLKFVKFFL